MKDYKSEIKNIVDWLGAFPDYVEMKDQKKAVNALTTLVEKAVEEAHARGFEKGYRLKRIEKKISKLTKPDPMTPKGDTIE